MKDVKLPAVGRVELSIIEEEMPELLAFDKGDFDYALLGGSASRRLLHEGKLQARLRGARHPPHPLSGPGAPLHVLQPGRPRRRRQCAGQDRAAPRDRPRLQRAGVHPRRPGRRRPAGDAAAAARRRRPRRERRSAPRTIPAAARALLDRFGYKDRDGDGYRERPDGTPLVLVQNVDARHAGARDRPAVAHEHEGDRPPHAGSTAAPFADLLKQANAGPAADASTSATARRARRGSRSSRRCGARRRPTPIIRTFATRDYDAGYEAFLRTPPGPARNALARRMSDIVAAYAPILYRSIPGRQCVYATVAQGLLPGQFRLHLEVPRHRPRQEARRAQMKDPP